MVRVWNCSSEVKVLWGLRGMAIIRISELTLHLEKGWGGVPVALPLSSHTHAWGIKNNWKLLLLDTSVKIVDSLVCLICFLDY